VSELYEQFAKFSKSEVQHFHKHEQQRKNPRTDEAHMPLCYNDSHRSYPKSVHSIDSDGCGPPENWEKNFGTPPPQDRNPRSFDQRSPQYSQRVLAVIKCIYLPPIYLYSIQDIEDMFLLPMSSTSFVDLPLQEHRMTEKHHMDQNPYIS
jgi:hypothetical protein